MRKAPSSNMIWVAAAILLGTNVAVFRVAVPLLANLQSDWAIAGSLLVSLVMLAVDAFCAAEFLNLTAVD